MKCHCLPNFHLGVSSIQRLTISVDLDPLSLLLFLALRSDGTPVRVGRLGPTDVTFDIMANVGTVIVEADRLGVRFHEFSLLSSTFVVCYG